MKKISAVTPNWFRARIWGGGVRGGHLGAPRENSSEKSPFSEMKPPPNNFTQVRL